MPELSPLLAQSRRALLDALQALEEQRAAVIVVGAQAIYLHADHEDAAIATETKDSDLVLSPLLLQDHPLLEDAMTGAKSTRIWTTRSLVPGSAPMASPST